MDALAWPWILHSHGVPMKLCSKNSEPPTFFLEQLSASESVKVARYGRGWVGKLLPICATYQFALLEGDVVPSGLPCRFTDFSPVNSRCCLFSSNAWARSNRTGENVDSTYHI